MFMRVKDEPDLVRDQNGTIQNINQNEYEAYMAKRRAVADQRNRMNELENRVASMENNIAMILQLLRDRK